jgi:hypothetical protein
LLKRELGRLRHNFKYLLQSLCRPHEDGGEQLQRREVVWSCSRKHKLVLKVDIYYITLVALTPDFNIDVFVSLGMYFIWRNSADVRKLAPLNWHKLVPKG